jgi:hypothetical protein
MALYSPHASGLGNSAAYQVAGKPYLTGSAIAAETSKNYLNSKEYKVEFPTVTRKVTIYNYSNDADLAVYFTSKAVAPATIVGVHFAIVGCQTGSIEMNIKCKELYISPFPTNDYGGSGGNFVAGTFGVSAELTGVPASDMYALTGSGINVSTYGDGQQ